MEILSIPDGVIPDTYVSFADPDRGFLGVVVAPTDDPGTAIDLINAAGVNPGGQAVLVLVPPAVYPHLRLLSREELVAITGEFVRLRDLPKEQQEAFIANSFLLCEDCNNGQQEDVQ